jgi:hypothetical protein
VTVKPERRMNIWGICKFKHCGTPGNGGNETQQSTSPNSQSLNLFANDGSVAIVIRVRMSLDGRAEPLAAYPGNRTCRLLPASRVRELPSSQI